jgi:hypothetical protein
MAALRGGTGVQRGFAVEIPLAAWGARKPGNNLFANVQMYRAKQFSPVKAFYITPLTRRLFYKL